jgi:hypothetical protein
MNTSPSHPCRSHADDHQRALRHLSQPTAGQDLDSLADELEAKIAAANPDLAEWAIRRMAEGQALAILGREVWL